MFIFLNHLLCENRNEFFMPIKDKNSVSVVILLRPITSGLYIIHPGKKYRSFPKSGIRIIEAVAFLS
jgi:hypothetical protein